jgi:hypothetical protein
MATLNLIETLLCLERQEFNPSRAPRRPLRRAGVLVAFPRGRAPHPNRAPCRPGSRAAKEARTGQTAAPPARRPHTRRLSKSPLGQCTGQRAAAAARSTRATAQAAPCPRALKRTPLHPAGGIALRTARPARSPLAHFCFNLISEIFWQSRLRKNDKYFNFI